MLGEKKEPVTGARAALGGLFPPEQAGSGACIQACPKGRAGEKCRLRTLFPLHPSAPHKDRWIPSNLTQLWTLDFASVHRTSDRQTGRQTEGPLPPVTYTPEVSNSLHMGMGVAGKRTWSRRPSLGTLSCVRARRSWKGAVLGMVTGTGGKSWFAHYLVLNL